MGLNVCLSKSIVRHLFFFWLYLFEFKDFSVTKDTADKQTYLLAEKHHKQKRHEIQIDDFSIIHNNE